MGDRENAPLGLQFNSKVRLEFHGAAITSDAGLLPIRELENVLGLTHIAHDSISPGKPLRSQHPTPPRPYAQTVRLQSPGWI